MTEDELEQNYLSRFPTILQEALKSTKNRSRFLRTVSENYSPIIVYRAIHRKNEIAHDDFICNIEEGILYNRFPEKIPTKTIEWYAVSVFENPENLVTATHLPNANRPLLGVAKGVLTSQYGPADGIGCKDHHNWYIFQDSIDTVKDGFEIINIEDIIIKDDFDS